MAQVTTQLTTISRPYARAAFEVAQANKEVSAWLMALHTLALVVAHDGVSVYITNPTVSTEQGAKLILDVLGAELNTEQQNFVRLLAEKRQLALLPIIEQLFFAFHARELQTVNVTVFSATEMSEAQKTALTTALAQRLQKKVALDVQLDTSVIGGAVIRTDEWVIDGSVKGKLQQLKSRVVG
jgi:F-type H+-transporting ATPase subunit delta